MPEVSTISQERCFKSSSINAFREKPFTRAPELISTLIQRIAPICGELANNDCQIAGISSEARLSGNKQLGDKSKCSVL